MKKIIEELKIQDGEFILICGKSGSGKTTLLKALLEFYKEKNITAGYVMQNFDAQIVTDKVWHEMAFALENQGMERNLMHRRVAEAATYFGITDWLERDTAFLSGGQKQLLNLASVMAMTPKVLLLDEPTSQLDPIAAQNFLATVKKINRQFGTTVIITEHRLEELFTEADRVLLMDQLKVKGCFEIHNSKIEIHEKNEEILNDLWDFLPVTARISRKIDELENKKENFLPLDIVQGRKRVKDWSGAKAFLELRSNSRNGGESRNRGKPDGDSRNPQKILEIRDLSFKYGRNMPEILCQMNFSVNRGEIFAILGANGSGKSTLLKILCGIEKGYKGKIKWFRQAQPPKSLSQSSKKLSQTPRILMLPQNVRNVFTKKTVLEELGGNFETKLISPEILNSHPYDISGGEQQKLGLAKILMQKPDIILLDEPTKGLDSVFKKEFREILKEVANSGTAVILVSHDIEFCALTADRISLMFEGQLTGTGTPEEFFSGNSFYTTAVNRLTRGILEGFVTEEDFE